MRYFDMVFAADLRRGIGKGGTLPWKLPADMKYFRRLTTVTADMGSRNAVIMGRKTWDSIPAKFRPLDGRLNIVISRKEALDLPAEVVHAKSLESALESAFQDNIENVFVIGGGEIYKIALLHRQCKRLYITDIHADFDCDTFFPDYNQNFVAQPGLDVERQSDNGIEYEFKTFVRRDLAEHCAAGSGAKDEHRAGR